MNIKKFSEINEAKKEDKVERQLVRITLPADAEEII